MPKQLLPSRYKATITTRVNEMKQMITESEAKIEQFQAIDDADEAFKASKELKNHASKLKAKLTTFQATWDKWCTEIEAITNQTLKDTEQDEQDNHKQIQSYDECNLEAEVCEAVAMISEVIESKTLDLERLAKYNSIKAQQANSDLQTQANKTLLDDEIKAKKLLVENEVKAKQAVIDTIANEARAKQSLVDTIANEARAKQTIIEKEYEARQQAIDDELAVKKEILEKQKDTHIAPLQAGVAQFSRGPSGDHSQTIQVQCQAQTHSLPPLSLPKFDGSPWKYSEFMERFKSMIDSSERLDVTEKHTYLRMCLHGEAEKAVKHLPMTKDFYEQAKTTLKESFYRPMTCKLTLIRKLNDLSCNKSSWQSQLDMTREANALVNELISIRDGDRMEATQLILVSKYSEKLQEHIFKQMKEKETQAQEPLTILDTIKAIERYVVDKIDIQSSIQSFNRPLIDSSNQERRSNIELRHNEPASTVQYSPSPSNNRYKNCVFCHKHDNSFECNTVRPIQDRIKFLKENNRCLRCLIPGHFQYNCSAICSKCGLDHHAAICITPGTGSNAVPLGPSNRGYQSRNHSRNNQGSQNQQTMAHVQVETPILPAPDATALHSIQSDNPFHTQPKMWTGNVMVQNAVTKANTRADYMMDSGAMFTFITPSLARQLNLTSKSSHRMEINLAGGGKVPTDNYDMTEITLCKGQYKTTLDAIIYKANSLTGLLTNTYIPECDLKFISECENNAVLADAPDRSHPVKPQILISVSDTMRMLKDGGTIRRLPSGMTMIPTYLGNMIGGKEHSPREFTNHDKRLSEQLPANKNDISCEIPDISGKIIETRGDNLYIGFIQPATESMRAFAVDELDPNIGRQVVPFSSLNDKDSPILFYAPNSKPDYRRHKAKKKNENDPLYRVQLNATTFATLSSKRKMKPWQIRALTEEAEERAKAASETDPPMLASLTLTELSNTISNVAPREIIDIPLSAITSKLSKTERTRIWHEKHKKKDPKVMINVMSINVETNQNKCYEMVDNDWKNEGQLTGSKEQWLAAYKAIPRSKYGIDRWKISSVLFDRTNPMTSSSHISDVP